LSIEEEEERNYSMYREELYHIEQKYDDRRKERK
jgi:hypothetical protein